LKKIEKYQGIDFSAEWKVVTYGGKPVLARWKLETQDGETVLLSPKNAPLRPIRGISNYRLVAEAAARFGGIPVRE